LLERLADTAELYRSRALGFTCEETIRWDRRGETGWRRFGYVVVYDEATGFADYRTRLRSGTRKTVPKQVEPADFGVPAYLRSVYLWPFVFRRSRQAFHTYAWIGSEEVLGRRADLVRFEPIAPYRAGVNEWFGTAWIDSETAQLLKVEARHAKEQAELERLERHRAGEAASSWTYQIESLTTEYTVEKNGLRLPGKVDLLRESFDLAQGRSGWDEGRRVTLRVSQTYRRYRFFGVETDAGFDDPDGRGP
jgi:hypothetical protein